MLLERLHPAFADVTIGRLVVGVTVANDVVLGEVVAVLPLTDDQWRVSIDSVCLSKRNLRPNPRNQLDNTADGRSPVSEDLPPFPVELTESETPPPIETSPGFGAVQMGLDGQAGLRVDVEQLLLDARAFGYRAVAAPARRCVVVGRQRADGGCPFGDDRALLELHVTTATPDHLYTELGADGFLGDSAVGAVAAVHEVTESQPRNVGERLDGLAHGLIVVDGFDNERDPCKRRQRRKARTQRQKGCGHVRRSLTLPDKEVVGVRDEHDVSIALHRLLDTGQMTFVERIEATRIDRVGLRCVLEYLRRELARDRELATVAVSDKKLIGHRWFLSCCDMSEREFR